MERRVIGRGGSAEVLEWTEGRVVKLFHPWCAQVAEREFERASIVYASGVSSPAVYELITFEGRLGIVFERVEGEPLYKRVRGTADGAIEVGHALAELHRQLHEFQVEGLNDLIAIMEQDIADFPSIADQNLCRAYLAQLPRGIRLFHGNFHPGNVLMASPPVFIDWDDAFMSHPALDVGRTSILTRFQGRALANSPDKLVRETTLRRIIADTYLEHYLSITGVSRIDVARSEVLFATALLTIDPSDDIREYLTKLPLREDY